MNLLARLFSYAAILFIFGVFTIQHHAFNPGKRQQVGDFTIKKGAGLMSIARGLSKQGYIDSSYVFVALNIIKGAAKKIKAGEYRIPPYASPHEISQLFILGKTYLHPFLAVEGETVHQIYANIAGNDKLAGNLPELVPEGVLMPDTYKFERGEPRTKLIQRMNKEMQRFLTKAWQNRAPNLPLKSPLEALILASIIEKEAALDHERAHVSAVFINRLKKNMPFQSCATVIYAMTKGERKLARKLLRSDLDFISPHNTYLHRGFPPSPICCPGREAIHAALHPSDSKALYFVINGEGGHNFSPSFAQHNRNIREAKRNGAYR